MVGMRNVLIHEYFRVKPIVLYETVRSEFVAMEKGFLIFYRPNVLLGIIVFSLLSFWIYTYHILKSYNLEENC